MLAKSTYVVAAMFLALSLSSCTSKEKKQIESEQAAAQARADAERALFANMKPEEIESRAENATIYGYPLVLMDTTRKVMTSVNRPHDGKGPINQFSHLRRFPEPQYTDVVSPNADTLYSSAWLDLSKEPLVLSVPATGTRYYMIQMLDGWTNVFTSLGTRTTGNVSGSYAIVGPNWEGTLPAGIRRIQSPTDMAWIIGRVKASGPKDFSLANTIQDRITLTPLSSWGKPYLPPDMVGRNDMSVDASMPPPDQVARMNFDMFVPLLSELMVGNPPANADAEAVDNLAKIGVKPGGTINYSNLSPEVNQALARGVQRGMARISALAKSPSGREFNGWRVMEPIGVYGVDFEQRAAVAKTALGANVPEDAVYPVARVDASGNPLNGANKYVIRFPKNGTPPVNGFWSLTMYNSQQRFVPNKLNRYAIGDRSKLRKNRDGSTDIYISASSPGKKMESNWLPAPHGDFNVMMRLYWPKQAVLDNEWQIPGIQKSRVPAPRLQQRKLSKRLARVTKN